MRLWFISFIVIAFTGRGAPCCVDAARLKGWPFPNLGHLFHNLLLVGNLLLFDFGWFWLVQNTHPWTTKMNGNINRKFDICDFCLSNWTENLRIESKRQKTATDEVRNRSILDSIELNHRIGRLTCTVYGGNCTQIEVNLDQVQPDISSFADTKVDKSQAIWNTMKSCERAVRIRRHGNGSTNEE